jgi:hypothetical protein
VAVRNLSFLSFWSTNRLLEHTVMRYMFRVLINFFISFMSLPNNTPTSSRHRSPRISAAATNKSAASSSTSAPSVTRTLNYEDVEDAEDDEEVAAAVRGVESAQETQQSVMTQPVAGGKNFLRCNWGHFRTASIPRCTQAKNVDFATPARSRIS